MSLPGSDPTPSEALEWALADTPGAAEEFARAEVARLRAIEAKFAACVELVGELEPDHAQLCPRAHAGWGHCRCICDFDAREALRKLVES